MSSSHVDTGVVAGPASQNSTMNRVLIGLVPLPSPGWLAYVPVSSSIPYDPGFTAFVLVFFPMKTVSYEIQIGSYTDGQKPFERVSSSIIANMNDSVEDRIAQWCRLHPTHELLEVGYTSRGEVETSAYHKAWRKNQLKYHVFWDNNSSFVDQFTTFFVEENPTWKIRIGTQGGVPGSTGGGGLTKALFDSPLAFAIWKKKHSADGYWKFKQQLNDTLPRRRNSVETSYSMSMDDDGRLNVEIDGVGDDFSYEDAEEKSVNSASSFSSIDVQSPADSSESLDQKYPPETQAVLDEYKTVPSLNIVIMIVGSRGDVQPFIALGKELQKYGHRVRLATHAIFRQFVTDSLLEFFPLAGDPNELMAYMVKNPGLLPGMQSIQQGDIGKKRKMVEAILETTYQACVRPDPEDSLQTPFVCHAIISNPPAFGHIHCAQRLFVPVHIFFTMPWSPTRAFPHPLVNVNYTTSSLPMTNYFSYELVEFMTWEGLGDIINNFRKNTLGLPKISTSVAPTMLKNLSVPHSYTWSEALIPKPKDWGSHIDITGFFFLDLATGYEPPPDLAAFLAAGPPPVYIGFGSIVVEDPDSLTQLIFQAVEKANVRALVSKGWGGIGGESLKVPQNVFLIGNCPHDWLFQRVSAVVHHGGAGTTAAGLKAGKPTVIVPFFGDQPFWGAMIASIGAGPPPIPFKKLTADRLTNSIKFSLLPDTANAAHAASVRIAAERGVEEGARSFHRHLPLETMRCDVDPSKIASWYVSRLNIKISREIAALAVREGRLQRDELLPYRYIQWEPENAHSSSIVRDVQGHMEGILPAALVSPRSPLSITGSDQAALTSKTPPPLTPSGAVPSFRPLTPGASAPTPTSPGPAAQTPARTTTVDMAASRDAPSATDSVTSINAPIPLENRPMAAVNSIIYTSTNIAATATTAALDATKFLSDASFKAANTTQNVIREIASQATSQSMQGVNFVREATNASINYSHHGVSVIRGTFDQLMSNVRKIGGGHHHHHHHHRSGSTAGAEDGSVPPATSRSARNLFRRRTAKMVPQVPADHQTTAIAGGSEAIASDDQNPSLSSPVVLLENDMSSMSLSQTNVPVYGGEVSPLADDEILQRFDRVVANMSGSS